MEPALDVHQLSVHFGNVEVFSNLTFTVPKGSSLAVIGPNGAGKTVLFHALIGSVPSEGSIHWASGTHIGYVPQKLDIERDIPVTGLDFLRARARINHASEGEISRTLDLVGIPKEISHGAIGTLSGGQFQRLLVAFALLGHPTVVMLDEPTAGVDEPGQKLLNDLVRHLQEEHGLTVLFISHEISVVYQYATNVLCLGHQHTYFGPPKKILTPEMLSELYGSPVNYHVHEH